MSFRWALLAATGVLLPEARRTEPVEYHYPRVWRPQAVRHHPPEWVHASPEWYAKAHAVEENRAAAFRAENDGVWSKQAPHPR